MNRTDYVYGNTARKIKTPGNHKRFSTVPGGRKAVRSSRASALVHLMLMAAALIVTSFTLYHYVDVQTSLESSVTQISSLEKQLATLRQENDEAYSRANSRVDLEEVKRIAIQELGMKYADEGQIVIYSDEGAEDYVRQVAKIPEVENK